MNEHPEAIFFCGPNGGGKSTVYRSLAAQKTLRDRYVYINTDDNLANLKRGGSQATDRAAARLSIMQLDQALRLRENFIFETTFSSAHSVDLVSRAKTAGYAVGMVFVMLENVDLHCLRVKERHERGGHFIPADVVVRRYDRCLQNLSRCRGWFDQGRIFDNTRPDSLRETFRIVSARWRPTEQYDPSSVLDSRLYNILCVDRSL